MGRIKPNKPKRQRPKECANFNGYFYVDPSNPCEIQYALDADQIES